MCLRPAFFLTLLILPFITACSQTSKNPQSSISCVTVEKNKRRYLVVLDPGHGGFDMGATSHRVEEKTLTLRMATLVRQHLSRMGYRVILTRSRDVFLPLDKRTAIANQTKSHLLVSLHFNAFKNPNAKGIEIYYYAKGSKWRHINSKKLAQSVLSRMLSQTGASSRGIKCGNFHIVREANMPAILVEGGFITHPQERDQLRDRVYLNRLAKGVAEGIDSYFIPFHS